MNNDSKILTLFMLKIPLIHYNKIIRGDLTIKNGKISDILDFLNLRLI